MKCTPKVDSEMPNMEVERPDMEDTTYIMETLLE